MKESDSPPSRTPPNTKQIVVGESALGSNGSRPRVGERTHLSQVLHQDFLPLGLYVQGATSDTKILRIHCGNWRVDGDSSIPALYFSTHKTLLELERLAELGEIAPLPWQRFEMTELCVGARWTIEVEGPLDGICLWGLTYRDCRPSERIEVQRIEGDTAGTAWKDVWHVGQLFRETLSGPQCILTVKSPTEDGVCRLLSAYRETGALR